MRIPPVRRRMAGAAVLLGSLLAGCGSLGASTGDEERPLAQGAAVARGVTLCETTFEQLRTQLGAPSRDGRLGRRRIASWITDWKPLTRYLGVLLDERGVVVDIYWDVPSEVAWTPTDQCVGRR